MEGGIQLALFLCAVISVFTTAGIIAILCTESWTFFRHVSVFEYLFGTEWTPLFEPQQFGVLPLLAGTSLVAVCASILAVPIGVCGAVFLSEYASNGIRNGLKPVLEILAGIPTIVYGFFGLTVVTPFLRLIFPQIEIFNALSASIVVAIMVLPMIITLSDDAMRAVPRSLRYAGYALGGTQHEVSAKIVLPAAMSGVMASVVLAISRAVGETMAVTLAAGSRPNLSLNPLESIQTMTAYIAQVSLGDTPAGTIEYQTIFAVGMTLFAITFVMNVAAQHLLNRLREQYE